MSTKPKAEATSKHVILQRIAALVPACGMAKYENDASVAPVFERADQKMYENKSDLKGGRLT